MKLFTALLLLVMTTATNAETSNIDLRCEELANKMIQRLTDEGLLASSGRTELRTRAITLELCTEAQKSAEQQHEKNLQQSLKNWITESTGGKEGNKRLRNLKK